MAPSEITRSLRFAGLSAWLLLSLATPPTSAQTVNEKQPSDSKEIRDTHGWHVVREGESLDSITEHYLGTPHLWHENAKLNPGMVDPYRVYVGQRIKVIIQREVPARQVEIRKVANSVNKNLQRIGWQAATAGDLLKPLDGVQTQLKSSAELAFDDGSMLTLGEHSTVFVKDVHTTLRGVRRGTIVIEKGQAEFVLEARRPDRTQIEVVTGSAITRPQVGPSGTARTRARNADSGGSRVMVYGGQADVESAGVKVAVGHGMGTAVPEGAAPKPPEKLLPRPRILSPSKRSEWTYSNPRMSWQAVPAAISYTVEICHDETCGELESRVQGLKDTSWIPEDLPAGDLFWRVTAIAASGLDGYPSTPVPFRLLSERPDLEPPVVVAQLRGPGYASRDGGFVLGVGGGLKLLVHDDASGVAQVHYRWTSGSWTAYGNSAIFPPSTGRHVLEFKAVDQLGHESRVWSIAIEGNDKPPSAPTVEVSSP